MFHPLSLLNNNRGVFGTNMGRLFDEFARLTPDMVEIVRLLGEGTLAPVVDKVFPFAQAAAAHQYIQDRRNFGKVLLRAEGGCTPLPRIERRASYPGGRQPSRRRTRAENACMGGAEAHPLYPWQVEVQQG